MNKVVKILILLVVFSGGLIANELASKSVIDQSKELTTTSFCTLPIGPCAS